MTQTGVLLRGHELTRTRLKRRTRVPRLDVVTTQGIWEGEGNLFFPVHTVVLQWVVLSVILNPPSLSLGNQNIRLEVKGVDLVPSL